LHFLTDSDFQPHTESIPLDRSTKKFVTGDYVSMMSCVHFQKHLLYTMTI